MPTTVHAPVRPVAPARPVTQDQHTPSLRSPTLSLRSLTLGVSVLLLATSFGGCASWDPETFFPEDYEASYTQVHACKKGAHPAGDYIVTWVNPAGKDAFERGTTPFPEGTILLKSQFSDERCTEQTRFTVMKKGAAGTAPDSGDWFWQLVDNEGGSRECCDGANGCVSCHTPCKGGDWVCTKPKK